MGASLKLDRPDVFELEDIVDCWLWTKAQPQVWTVVITRKCTRSGPTEVNFGKGGHKERASNSEQTE